MDLTLKKISFLDVLAKMCTSIHYAVLDKTNFTPVFNQDQSLRCFEPVLKCPYGQKHFLGFGISISIYSEFRCFLP